MLWIWGKSCLFQNHAGECESPKKKKKKKKIPESEEEIDGVEESEDEGKDPALDSLSQTIAFQIWEIIRL